MRGWVLIGETFMKKSLFRVFVALAACSTVAWPQSPSVRARVSPTAVKPARTPPPLRVPQSATDQAPIPALTPRHDRITDKPHHFQIALSPRIAAVYQPLGQQVEVFAIDAHGALKDVWKHHNGFWEAAFPLSGPGFAPPGAPLTAVWYPMNEQLEV